MSNAEIIKGIAKRAAGMETPAASKLFPSTMGNRGDLFSGQQPKQPAAPVQPVNTTPTQPGNPAAQQAAATAQAGLQNPTTSPAAQGSKPVPLPSGATTQVRTPTNMQQNIQNDTNALRQNLDQTKQVFRFQQQREQGQQPSQTAVPGNVRNLLDRNTPAQNMANVRPLPNAEPVGQAMSKLKPVGGSAQLSPFEQQQANTPPAPFGFDRLLAQTQQTLADQRAGNASQPAPAPAPAPEPPARTLQDFFGGNTPQTGPQFPTATVPWDQWLAQQVGSGTQDHPAGKPYGGGRLPTTNGMSPPTQLPQPPQFSAPAGPLGGQEQVMHQAAPGLASQGSAAQAIAGKPMSQAPETAPAAASDANRREATRKALEAAGMITDSEFGAPGAQSAPTPTASMAKGPDSQPQPAAGVNRYHAQINRMEQGMPQMQQALAEARARGDVKSMKRIENRIRTNQYQINRLKERGTMTQAEQLNEPGHDEFTKSQINENFRPGGTMDWFQQRSNNVAAGKPINQGVTQNHPGKILRRPEDPKPAALPAIPGNPGDIISQVGGEAPALTRKLSSALGRISASVGRNLNAIAPPATGSANSSVPLGQRLAATAKRPPSPPVLPQKQPAMMQPRAPQPQAPQPGALLQKWEADPANQATIAADAARRANQPRGQTSPDYWWHSVRPYSATNMSPHNPVPSFRPTVPGGMIGGQPTVPTGINKLSSAFARGFLQRMIESGANEKQIKSAVDRASGMSEKLASELGELKELLEKDANVFGQMLGGLAKGAPQFLRGAAKAVPQFFDDAAQATKGLFTRGNRVIPPKPTTSFTQGASVSPGAVGAPPSAVPRLGYSGAGAAQAAGTSASRAAGPMQQPSNWLFRNPAMRGVGKYVGRPLAGSAGGGLAGEGLDQIAESMGYDDPGLSEWGAMLGAGAGLGRNFLPAASRAGRIAKGVTGNGLPWSPMAKGLTPGQRLRTGLGTLGAASATGQIAEGFTGYNPMHPIRSSQRIGEQAAIAKGDEMAQQWGFENMDAAAASPIGQFMQGYNSGDIMGGIQNAWGAMSPEQKMQLVTLVGAGVALPAALGALTAGQGGMAAGLGAAGLAAGAYGLTSGSGTAKEMLNALPPDAARNLVEEMTANGMWQHMQRLSPAEQAKFMDSILKQTGMSELARASGGELGAPQQAQYTLIET